MKKIKELSGQDKKIIRAWCMYDWANSGFATSGTVALFPVYFVYLFNEALGDNVALFGLQLTGSSMWSIAIAISTAIVALSSPVLGVIADRVKIKKTLLWLYTITGSIFTVLAFFSAYTSHPWAWLFGTFLVANVGFAGSLVFYNSLLPHLAPRELVDNVSSKGFAYGYMGGGLLLLIHFALNFIATDTNHADLVTRMSIASIGLWWFGWALWTFRLVPEPPIAGVLHSRRTAFQFLILALQELNKTFKEIKRFRVVLIYLGSYLAFNDGIQTVLTIAGAFAADTLGIPLSVNMATILIIQFVAIPGALLFNWIAERITTKNALIVSLVGWSFVVLFGVGIAPLVPDEHHEFEYQLSYQDQNGKYLVVKAPALGDSDKDKVWGRQIGEIKTDHTVTNSTARSILSAFRASESTPYSISISGGVLDGSSFIGALHPSSIGSGPLDWWPNTVRQTLWEPVALTAWQQWLILGLMVGLVMGGSQALARSLFSQITPETRSGEFFSFFGFTSRASSVFGPMIYVVMTGMFDTRVAVASILVIIVVGTITLKWVDVPVGVVIAAKEDVRLRM